MIHATTVPEALAKAAEHAGPQVGYRFLDRQERPTWWAMDAIWLAARKAAGALYEAGVRPGDRVAIVLPTDPTFLSAYYGAQVLGAVPVPLYPPVRLGRLDEYIARTARMLELVHAKVVVTQPRIQRLFGEVFAHYPPPLGFFDAARLADGPPRDAHPVGPEDLAMVQFSSGTTVDPKPVALSHAAILANARAVTQCIEGVQPADQGPPSGVSWLPLYHDMGLIGCLLPALLAPGSLTLIPPEVFLAKPAIWLRALSTYRAIISPAPNFAYNLCVERVAPDALEGLDLSAWKMALNGAETVRASTLEAFAERFGPYGFAPNAAMPVYGLSEMSLAVAFSPADALPTVTAFSADGLAEGIARPPEAGEAAHRLVSVGYPLEGFALAIRDSEGHDLPEGQVGHLWCSGPSMMTRYLSDAPTPIQEGWLHTGDLGFLYQGQLYLSGRAKDLIILRGKNHAPQDLEAAVDAVPGIRQGCSAAVADLSDEGERLVLFVEVRDPQEGQAEACLRAVRATTGVAPDLVVLLDPGALPRTSSGKIRRAEALRRWHAGELTPPKKVTPWFLAGAMAKSAWAFWKGDR